jgi:hypothetical protein
MATKNSLADGLRSLSNKPTAQPKTVENAAVVSESGDKGKLTYPKKVDS